MRHRELTYEEACTLYDAGLRGGVEWYSDNTWLHDPDFDPREYHHPSHPIRYRIPINEE